MTRFLPGMLVFALLGLLILQWRDWPPSSSPAGVGETSNPPPAVPIAPVPDPLAGLHSPDDKDGYASVIERPLFRPDRRPEPQANEEPEAQPNPEAKVELHTIDLTAIVMTPTIVSAWVKDPSQPKPSRLRIGDELMGWSVREILEDRVLLERQGEKDALILRDYSQSPPAAAPAPVPRRPPQIPVPRPPPRTPEGALVPRK